MLNYRICSSVRHWLVAVTIFSAILKPAYSEGDEVTSAFEYCSSYKSTLKFSGDPLVIYKSTVKLSDDQTVLCFDGPINSNQDMSDFHALKPNGLLVMRSPGGYAHAAMTLSNILRDKTATVVLRDYCLSACASFVLVATGKTYVKKNTIVAGHDVGLQRYQWLSEYECTDLGLERLRLAVMVQTPRASGKLANITDCTKNSSNKGGSTTATYTRPDILYQKNGAVCRQRGIRQEGNLLDVEPAKLRRLFQVSYYTQSLRA